MNDYLWALVVLAIWIVVFGIGAYVMLHRPARSGR